MRLQVVLLTMLLGGGIAMAQPTPAEVQAQIDDLKKQKELLDAEKARLEAEKAKIDAAKALLAAQQPENPDLTAAQKDAASAKVQKDLLDAQKNLLDAQKALEKAQQPVDTRLEDLKNKKALADAQKDAATSETDALKAQLFGTVTGGPFTGAVELKDKAGVAEANLLASQAIRSAAVRIASRVRTVKQADLKDVKPPEVKDAKPADLKPEATSKPAMYLFSVKDFPNFQRLLTFRFRKELLKQAYQNAGVSIEAQEMVATPALVSAGLDAFSKILGFFKSDFTVGGFELKPEESQLLFAVAGSLHAWEVHLPAIYNPTAQASAVGQLAKELSELVRFRAKADSEAKALSTQIDVLDKGSEAEKKTAAALKPKLEQLKGVIALHDSFVSSLTTPDTNGALPLASLAQEFAIDKALQEDKAVLLIKLENAGGGYFVKKNLFTGLGAMPLYHMGGATASFLQLGGKAGQVLAADVVPVHGGFVKAGRVADELAKDPM